MKLTTRKLQKAMDKYYYNNNRINVEQINNQDSDMIGLNGHQMKTQSFSITSPYYDAMGDHIILSLYYDDDDSVFILSDDGMTYSSIMNIHNHAIRQNLIKYAKKYLINPDTKNCSLKYYLPNQSFQAKFTDIKYVTCAYHALMQVLIAFQSVAQFQDLQRKHQVDLQKDTQEDTDAQVEQSEEYVKNQLKEHPDNTTLEKLYKQEENKRDKGLKVLDNIEELCKTRATKAYFRTLQEQIENANELLFTIYQSDKDLPKGMNAKHLAEHLDDDFSQFIHRVKATRPELQNK